MLINSRRMALNPSLLRSSFELVTTREPNIVSRFYEIFFERYPQVKPLFKQGNAETQHKKLGAALGAVLEHLEDSQWLTEQLGAMGHRHDGYGVTDDMYPWVGECLIAAMQEAAGDEWTADMTVAWSDAYGAIVSLMTAREGKQATS